MSKIDTHLFDPSQHALSEQLGDCPECQEKLLIKNGKSGPFIGCSNYPDCHFTKPLHEHESNVVKVLDAPCPECGEMLAVKNGRFGMFIGCSGYPECHFIGHVDEPEQTGVKCPACDVGQLQQKHNRQGKTFFACDQYPSCKYLLNEQPTDHPCPECGWGVTTIKETAKGMLRKCPQKKCNYKEIINAES